MILVTGAAGFIGSCMVSWLNSCGYEDLLVVDEFDTPTKESNLRDKVFSQKMDGTIF